jgi:ADP-heptose:LPS heptosyltransferase
MPPGRNILLFHAGALGDFVVTWPLALALARLHPQSRLFYVTQRGKGQLAENVLRVESSDAEAGWHPLYSAGPASLAEPQAKLLGGAHSVVSFAAAHGDPWTTNVRKLAPAADLLPMTVSPPADFAGHVTDHLLAQLGAWPAAQATLAQIIRSIASRGISASSTGPGAGGPVLVHPGSGAGRKCWPADRFLELIDRLRRDGRDVRVILGEVELEKWPASEVERFAAAAPLVKPATYIDLLDQLKSASAFVGNDTGPSHLAGIIGVPTVALFGPSNPIHWRPLGPKVQVLHAPTIDSIAIDPVHECVVNFLR